MGATRPNLRPKGGTKALEGGGPKGCPDLPQQRRPTQNDLKACGKPSYFSRSPGRRRLDQLYPSVPRNYIANNTSFNTATLSERPCLLDLLSDTSLARRAFMSSTPWRMEYNLLSEMQGAQAQLWLMTLVDAACEEGPNAQGGASR